MASNNSFSVYDQDASSRETSFNVSGANVSFSGNRSFSISTPKNVIGLRGTPLANSGKRRRTLLNTPHNASSGGTPLRSASHMSAGWLGTTHSTRVVSESAKHVLTSYGSYLPVLVVEALTFADASHPISVHVSSSNWAWLVCGRRLLVWPFNLQPNQHASDFPCRELPLPPSDLAHRADLVCVVPSERNRDIPSCVAASPEGLIRYWPNIAHEGNFVEVNAELQGQECDFLTPVLPLGFLLATTTSTVVLARLNVVSGRHTLSCRFLRAAHGLLGSLGRRLSSVIFGNMPSQSMDTKLVKIVSTLGQSTQGRVVFVLAGQLLQKWLLLSDGRESLIYECDIDRLVREVYQKQLWDPNVVSVAGVRSWLVDMQITGSQLMLLAAAVNEQVSSQLYYALGTVDIESNTPPSTMTSFHVLRLPTVYHQSDQEAETRTLRFALVGNRVYLYSKKCLRCVSVDNPGRDVEVIPLPSASDQILGVGICNNTFLVFLSEQWLVSVKPKLSQDASDISMSATSSALNVVLPSSVDYTKFSFSDARLNEFLASTDRAMRLKAAFVLFCSRNNGYQALATETFPVPMMQLDSEPELDSAVIQLSASILNDRPIGDLRWSEAPFADILGATQSVLIVNQLEEKKEVHSLFVEFIKAVGFWNRLSTINVHGTMMPTKFALCEHVEKLAATISLHMFFEEHKMPAVDSAMETIVQKRQIGTDKLPVADAFFVQVLSIDEIIPELVQWINTEISSCSHISEGVETLCTINSIVLEMTKRAMQVRQQTVNQLGIATADLQMEFIPWTHTSGTSGIKDSILNLYHICINHGLKSVDGSLLQRLLDQMVDLVDLLLDSFRAQMDSLPQSTPFERKQQLTLQYERERQNLMIPFLEAQEYERVTMLAEKYEEFLILVRVCIETGNQDRLENYMEKYQDKGFANFVYSWYMKERKPGQLLSRFDGRKHRDDLSRFLGNHPVLAVVNDIGAGRYKQAADMLQMMSSDEREFLYKKKSQLSLAKLMVLASFDGPEQKEANLAAINRELLLIAHQEQLPTSVLDTFGCDMDRMRVLTPMEIIELFVGEQNQYGDENDFKKALDTLQFLDEEQRKEAWLYIWCCAVLRDSWTSYTPADDATEVVSKSLVFRIVNLAAKQGDDIQKLLPPLNILLGCEQLSELASSATFQYLMKAGYEQVQRMIVE